MRTIVTLLLFITLSNDSYTQEVFSHNDLLDVVRRHHPVAQQASAGVNIAAAKVLSSRGAFDPVVALDQQQKTFEGTEYYRRKSAALHLPLWYGMDISTGTERADGSRLNREETSGSLSFLGIAIDPIKTIGLDKRRAALQQARIFRDRSEAERQAMINDIIADASYAYVDWWLYHEQLVMIQLFLLNAEERLKMVRMMFLKGERPAIDTLEAFTQVLQMKQLENAAKTKQLGSRMNLSMYLWNANRQGYELPGHVIPTIQAIDESELDTLLIAASTHPEISIANDKIRWLGVEKRLNITALLPDFSIKYNQLARQPSKIINSTWLRNSNQYGVSILLPLRFSEARGDLQSTKWRIFQQQVERQWKQQEINTTLRKYFLEWEQLTLQVQHQEKLVQSYVSLEMGEYTKFTNGESSLFLINNRQVKTFESQQKLLELKAARQKAAISLKWSAGILR